MSLQSKKMDMADKMYCQYGHPVGNSPKYKEAGKGEGSEPKFKMASRGEGRSSAVTMSADGSFKAKYSEAGKSDRSPMIQGHSKASQKGRASLESVKNDKSMYRKGNETNRA